MEILTVIFREPYMATKRVGTVRLIEGTVIIDCDNPMFVEILSEVWTDKRYTPSDGLAFMREMVKAFSRSKMIYLFPEEEDGDWIDETEFGELPNRGIN